MRPHSEPDQEATRLLSEEVTDSNANNSDSHDVIKNALTFRAVVAGILIGFLVCFSNVYLGLQAGVYNTLPMPSVILGWCMFKIQEGQSIVSFTPAENVIVQTVSGAVGGMPVTAGLVGLMPALEYLQLPEDISFHRMTAMKLLLWTGGVFPFGVVVAMIMRPYFTHKKRLPFPISTATAALIGLLHKNGQINENVKAERNPSTLIADNDRQDEDNAEHEKAWKHRLLATAAVSALSGLVVWLWELNISPAFIGYGMILPPGTVLSILLGSIVGWGVMSPVAKVNNWAPGPVADWETGSRGWIIWISLGFVLGDSVVNLTYLILRPSIQFLTSQINFTLRKQVIKDSSARYGTFISHELLGEALPANEAYFTQQLNETTNSVGNTEPIRLRHLDNRAQIQRGWKSPKSIIWWLIASQCICFGAVKLAFGNILPSYAIVLSIVFGTLLSYITIRSEGETGSTQADSISKMCQFVFAQVIHSSSGPRAVIANMITAGVVEAGTWEAAGMMSDLKVAQLVGAPPGSMFYGRLIGAFVGTFVSVLVYKIFTAAHALPDEQFQMPAARLWLATAKLAYGTGLPKAVSLFAGGGAVISMVCAVSRIMLSRKRWSNFIPSGIAISIGLYLLPGISIAEALGSLISSACLYRRPREHTTVFCVATGLILGESFVVVIRLLLQIIGRSITA